ncbi:tRNA pseudouridine(31) synthase [Nakaseomyces glabratus]|uniref:tRNA pseudouridine(31) synthase n=1 Tax=Candida glabrata TaxID=5478 RepID=A0A0W0E0K3_CANGB|nr:RNA pseudouridylate synthase [Nakaseomyces glabratus]KAH7598716.1 RNA pseudouridylate synthase [Nakaseomyces glabratus]KAH7612989.1 RNA pseudouridylate synthase [Nakaseomyces glabratus]KAI8386006.1 RNA pseudouridylate synthase [Nakaseomyces glabratus]KTB00174.1 tRNA pseudouridine(31) synthase [Nakaseomyces glabratus]
MSNIQYYYQSGLRKIYPYYHTRTAFVKGRWHNRTVLDVLVKEFRAHSAEYYGHQIVNGKYKLIRDGQYLDNLSVLDTPIKNNDKLESTVHKHEPPVLQWCSNEANIPGKKIAGIDIVYEDENLLVINKPCGIPIHPTGLYYGNTLTEILKVNGVHALPAYRLDKVTSGLLILSKDTGTASMVQKKIRSHEMQKWYLARVEGAFPHVNEVPHIEPPEIQRLDLPIEEQIIQDNSILTIEDSDVYTVEPKKQYPSGLSVPRSAKTIFYPIKYFPHKNESIVACRPITGRTHQIRIHLARLNHPIVNDTIYSQKITRYPERLNFIRSIANWSEAKLTDVELSETFQIFIQESEHFKKKALAENKNCPVCSECGALTLSDPDPEDLSIDLHAWRYSDAEKTLNFKTELPQWVVNE